MFRPDGTAVILDPNNGEILAMASQPTFDPNRLADRVTQVYFAITIIISLLAWTDLARVVRGKFLALREEDFVLAAELAGASQGRIIFHHMLPSFTSHLIASLTLSIPGMILGETALSFLGLGLRPPITSWGVLLNEAQNINVVALYPWLMLPVVPVILVVLAFNFLGDGLRDIDGQHFLRRQPLRREAGGEQRRQLARVDEAECVGRSGDARRLLARVDRGGLQRADPEPGGRCRRAPVRSQHTPR